MKYDIAMQVMKRIENVEFVRSWTRTAQYCTFVKFIQSQASYTHSAS